MKRPTHMDLSFCSRQQLVSCLEVVRCIELSDECSTNRISLVLFVRSLCLSESARKRRRHEQSHKLYFYSLPFHYGQCSGKFLLCPGDLGHRSHRSTITNPFSLHTEYRSESVRIRKKYVLHPQRVEDVYFSIDHPSL